MLGSAAVLRGGLWPPTPPLCRCAKHPKRLGGSEVVTGLGTSLVTGLVIGLAASRLIANRTYRTLSAVHSAQRHKGGAAGPRPARGTAAELSAPSAVSSTKQAKRTTNGLRLAIMMKTGPQEDAFLSYAASNSAAAHPLAPSAAKSRGWVRNPRQFYQAKRPVAL